MTSYAVSNAFTRLTKSDFARNVGKVASGSALAQLIALAASPLLTRLYGPEAFGVLGVLLAIAGPLSLLATARYDLAIVLPKSDFQAASLLRLAVTIAICVSSAAFLIAFFGRDFLAGYFDLTSYASYYWFIPIYVLVSGVSSSFNYWILRKKKFGRLTKSDPLSALISNGTTVALGVVSGNPVFLLFGNILTLLVRGAYLGRSSAKEIRNSLRNPPEDEMHAGVGRKYRDFPLYRAPQDLLNSLSQNVIGLLLAYYFSPAMLAQYWLSTRIIKVPSLLISGAVGQVFYQHIAALHNDGCNISGEVRRKTGVLCLLGLPIFGGSAFLSPLIFPIVFGADWSQAGYAASWVSLWLFAGFINTPCVNAMSVLRMQRLKLMYELVVLFLRASVVWLVAPRSDFLTTVAAASILGAMLNLGLVAAVLPLTARMNSSRQV